MKTKQKLITNPLVRVALMFIAGTIIWLLAFYIGGTFFGEADSGYYFDRHIAQAVIACVLTVPAVLLAWKYIDRRPWRELGLVRDGLKQFLIGASIWMIPTAIGLALCLMFGWVSIEMLRPAGEILAFIPVLILLVFIYESFPEELIFRGYIFANLSKKFKANSVVLIQASLFVLWGVIIGAATSIDRILLFFAIAWILGSIRRGSGNVWVTIGVHTAFQVTAQLLVVEHHGFFQVENGQILQLVALGIVPFTAAELMSRVIYRRKAKVVK